MPVVTGDTKVMESGALDKMVITTSAVGKRSRFLDHDLEVANEYRPVSSRWLTDDNIREGDVIIASGTMGDHGIALLSFREGYGFETEVKSDIAPLNRLVEDVLRVGGAVSMKDPTRGGFANAINEWSSKSGIGIEIDEAAVPVAEPVRNACELLGLDPLSVGNEGKMIIGVVPEMADEVLKGVAPQPGKERCHRREGHQQVRLRRIAHRGRRPPHSRGAGRRPGAKDLLITAATRSSNR